VKSTSLLAEVESQFGVLLIDRKVDSLSRDDESDLCELMKNNKYFLDYEKTQW
jgi:hypothetical protein